jgi:hypothetical protein
MTRILTLIGCLLVIYSCTTDSKDKSAAEKTFISIADVKKSLAKQDEIPADSIHSVKLKESDLYIFQGFGKVDNMIRLVKLNKDHFEIMDSLRVYKEDDSFGCKKIEYDYENDCFITEDVGTGSSSISLRKTIVRVKNNRFITLFSYTKYFFAIDSEVFPPIQETVEVRELERNKKRIILLTSYQMEYESSSGIHPKFMDTVTFDFSESQNCFIKKRYTNVAMQEKWSVDKGEYLFGL